MLFGSLLFSGFAFSQSSFADLSFSEEFGSKGDSSKEFNGPTDLALSNDGKNLYVVDSQNDRIMIFELTEGDRCPSGTQEVVEDEVCFDEDFWFDRNFHRRV